MLEVMLEEDGKAGLQYKSVECVLFIIALHAIYIEGIAVSCI